MLKIIVCVVVLVSLVVTGARAYAEAPTPLHLIGGAAINPHPRQLTTAEVQAVAQKRAAFETSLAFTLSSRASRRVGNPSLGAASGGVWTDIFEEPQYSPWNTESGN